MTAERGGSGQNPNQNFEQRPATVMFKDHLERKKAERLEAFSKKTRANFLIGTAGLTSAAGGTIIALENATSAPRTELNELFMNGGAVASFLGVLLTLYALHKDNRLRMDLFTSAVRENIKLEAKVEALQQELNIRNNPQIEE